MRLESDTPGQHSDLWCCGESLGSLLCVCAQGLSHDSGFLLWIIRIVNRTVVHGANESEVQKMKSDTCKS